MLTSHPPVEPRALIVEDEILKNSKSGCRVLGFQ